MIRKEHFNKTKIQSMYSDILLKNIELIPEIEECEYIYIDDLNVHNIKSTDLENKIIITQDTSNNFLMFDIQDIEENGHINNITKLESKQIVDLVILKKQMISKDMERFIDQDTIITKDLGNNVIYIQDKRKEISIFITEYEQFVIKSNGANTRMLYYDSIDT